MGAETQLLADIFTEISDVFAQHPTIAVTPIKGNPPEQYEIHYHIMGVYKDGSGQIKRSSDHTVTITIPFGFPHFPPSCKPKTPLFHPDFDPAAICLGDFWEHERSLPELIRVIGRMIAGEIYSKDNTFNEEAAIWYRENADQLPFVEAEPPSHDSLKEQDFTPLTPPELTKTFEVDTLDDSDFSSDFNYLGLERESRNDKKPADRASAPFLPETGSGEPDIDIETIWLLSRQKRFHQLESILKDFPATTYFEGKNELSEQIQSALSKARQMYSQGDSLEQQGLPGKALEKYLAVAELVSDYPKIQEDILRTEQSKDLLGEWVQGDKEKTNGTPAKPAKEKKTKPPQERKKRSQSEETEKIGQLTFFSEKNRRHLNIVPLVVIGCLLFIASPLIYFYLDITKQYRQAENLLNQCSNHLQAKQFEAASKTCGAAKSLANDILFLKNQARTALNTKAEAILNSEELRQGLAGFVLLEGKYVLKTTADTLKASKSILAEGDRLMSESNWQKAIETYTKGLGSGQQTARADNSYRSEIENKIHLAKTRLFMQKGGEEMARMAWQEAHKNFEQALTESKNLDVEVQHKLSAEIQPQLDKCSFLLLKHQGDKLFADSDWTGAFALFQKAISLGAKFDQSKIQELTTIQQDSIRAELYATINEGKAAFSSGQWDEAIKKYAKASKILMDNQGLLEQADLDQNRQKLARIMLQTSIIRDQREADKYIEKENWGEAETRIQRVIKSIDQSPVGAEKEFQTILSDSKKTAADLKEKLFIAGLIQHLEDNFQTLFSDNYPVAAPDTLTSPIISYVKQIEDKLLFKLECTEIGRGRPLKLVMYYTYSKSTEKWAFYSNTE